MRSLRRRHIVRLAFLLSVALGGAAHGGVGQAVTAKEQPLDPKAVEAIVDAAMAKAMHKTWAPGAIVSVVQGDRVLLTKGYGVADARTGRPIDPARTLFRVGSVTKVMTATAALRLADQGDLDLDRDVNATLKGLHVQRHEGWGPVTPRLLGSHRGGFDIAIFHLTTSDPKDVTPSSAATQRELGRVRPPSALPTYDNLGFGVLGRTIGDARGESYSAAMDRLVFKPLGMTATIGGPSDRAGDLASGHMPGPPGARARVIPQVYLRDIAQGGGDASVSATDMARFMSGLLGDNGFLSAKAWREMSTPAEALHPRLPALTWGWAIEDMAGRSAISKNGEINGFAAGLVLLPEPRVGVFISFNGLGKSPPQPRLSGLFDRPPSSDKAAPAEVRNALLLELATTLTPAPVSASASRPPIVERHAKDLAGLYFRDDGSKSLLVRLLAPGSGMTIVDLGDGRLANGRCTPFVRQAPMYYECRRPSGEIARLAFRVTSEGQIIGGHSPTNQHLRQPAWRGMAWTVAPLLPLALLQILALLRLRGLTAPAARRFVVLGGVSGGAFVAALLAELEWGWSVSHMDGLLHLAPWAWRWLFPAATLGLAFMVAAIYPILSSTPARRSQALSALQSAAALALALLSLYWGLATLSF